eukprot:TRINITY_DN17029_c0_g1_i7.p1 TRINITY_DN17029_c0_g1~~TRINITY_DN17029_c0_g1_i7.p1  ORF type:complete len:681 (-),score=100.57 TRINITY_DN17029_c0_g1_i7:100-2142(-)
MRAFAAAIVAALAVALGACGALASAGVEEETFDFVVVGGGLAGSVLANRLSASNGHSVLLLNVACAPPKAYAGPVLVTDEFITKHNLTRNDGLQARILQPGYAPMPKFSTDATGASPARWLGGSSLVGLSVYLRDHPEAIDAWGEGWSWEELRPYFHRAEGLQASPTALAESDYGRDGPFTVQELPAYTHPLTHEFVRAAQSANLPWAADLNTESGTGVGLTPTVQHADGTKVNAYDAYLRPALGRPNLVVRCGARADRLIIKRDRCDGVAYRRLSDETDHVVRARREVVLASGYIYSPRLLFLSGLGNANDLKAVGLSVVRDLPAVGRNLTAARFSPLAWHTTRPTLSQMVGPPISDAGMVAVPQAYGSAVLEATARFRSAAASRAEPKSSRPDVALSFMPLFYAPRSAPLQYSLQGESWPLKTNAFSLLVTLGETKAQGSVTFGSGSPDVSPIVTHDALADPFDLAVAEEAVEMARRIGGSGHIGQATVSVENGAGTPDVWTAVYDGRGTCRMGTEADTSVVDLALRVHGVQGLRVADGSVIPRGSPYFAQPEVLAVAERAADLILKDHQDSGHTRRSVTGGGNPRLALEANQTIPVSSLVRILGPHFSLMDAVNYLTSREVQSSAQGTSARSPVVATTWVVAAISMVSAAIGLAFVAASGIRGKAGASAANRVSLLS